MKKYPIEVRENVVARIHAGESQQALSREYGISRWAIQCWLKEPGKRVAAGFSVLYRKEVRPRVKYAVIYRHRNEYPISVMCCFFQVSRSGYYNFVHRIGRTEKDAALAKIIAEQRERSFRTYGRNKVFTAIQRLSYVSWRSIIYLRKSGGAENGSIWYNRYINTKTC